MVTNITEEDYRRAKSFMENYGDDNYNAAFENCVDFVYKAAEEAGVDLPGSDWGIESRFFYVTLEMARKVLDVCPDAQWRLVFGLARFGGLRCRSKVLRLKWQDVDFANDRFTVHAGKTEHHADGGIRTVPMFPELKPLFQGVFDEAPTGAVYCIDRYKGKWSNLGVHMA